MGVITIDGRCLGITDGVSVYARSLLKRLIDIDNMNIYRLILSRKTNGFKDGANLKVVNLRLPGRVLNGLWRRFSIFPMELFAGRADIFFSPNFTLPYLAQKTRTVITVHDLAFMKYPQVVTGSSRAFLEYWVPRSIKMADKIICVSNSTKNDIMEHFNIQENKMVVIHEGCDGRFRPLPDDGVLKERCRNKYGLPDRFILYLGTLEPRKNIPSLLKAFAKARHDIDGLKLVLAGKRGWLYQKIFDTIDDLGLQNDVFCAGAVDYQDLPLIYNLCEFFAFPSIYEGFGLPVLEAMACGKAVITSNISSLPEVGGDAVLLIDPNDIEGIAAALKKLSVDTAYRGLLEKKGLERARSFTWEDAARETVKIFNSLM